MDDRPDRAAPELSPPHPDGPVREESALDWDLATFNERMGENYTAEEYDELRRSLQEFKDAYAAVPPERRRQASDKFSGPFGRQ